MFVPEKRRTCLAVRSAMARRRHCGDRIARIVSSIESAIAIDAAVTDVSLRRMPDEVRCARRIDRPDNNRGGPDCDAAADADKTAADKTAAAHAETAAANTDARGTLLPRYSDSAP